MKIAILGAGVFGTALGGILADKGYDIDYYDNRLEKERLSDVLSDSYKILLAVPSNVAPYLLQFLPKNIPLVVATKGLLGDKYFKDFSVYDVISGPGFGDDIKARKKTLLTATSESVAELFRTDYLDFDITNDKNGVLLCGALKNVYAILAGIKNLVPSSNEHSNFLKQAASEMSMILKLNNADPETVNLACGKGDLKITCYYPSRNYEFGVKVSENADYRPEKTVEGFTALTKILRGEILVPEDATLLNELMAEAKKWN